MDGGRERFSTSSQLKFERSTVNTPPQNTQGALTEELSPFPIKTPLSKEEIQPLQDEDNTPYEREFFKNTAIMLPILYEDEIDRTSEQFKQFEEHVKSDDFDITTAYQLMSELIQTTKKGVDESALFDIRLELDSLLLKTVLPSKKGGSISNIGDAQKAYNAYAVNVIEHRSTEGKEELDKNLIEPVNKIIEEYNKELASMAETEKRAPQYPPSEQQQPVPSEQQPAPPAPPQEQPTSPVPSEQPAQQPSPEPTELPYKDVIIIAVDALRTTVGAKINRIQNIINKQSIDGNDLENLRQLLTPLGYTEELQPLPIDNLKKNIKFFIEKITIKKPIPDFNKLPLSNLALSNLADTIPKIDELYKSIGKTDFRKNLQPYTGTPENIKNFINQTITAEIEIINDPNNIYNILNKQPLNIKDLNKSIANLPIINPEKTFDPLVEQQILSTGITVDKNSLNKVFNTLIGIIKGGKNEPHKKVLIDVTEKALASPTIKSDYIGPIYQFLENIVTNYGGNTETVNTEFTNLLSPPSLQPKSPPSLQPKSSPPPPPPPPPSYTSPPYYTPQPSLLTAQADLKLLLDRRSMPLTHTLPIMFSILCISIGILLSLYYITNIIALTIKQRPLDAPLNNQTADFETIKSLNFFGGKFNYSYFLLFPLLAIAGVIGFIAMTFIVPRETPMPREVKGIVFVILLSSLTMLFCQGVIHVQVGKSIRAVSRRLTFFNRYVCSRIYKNYTFLQNIQDPKANILSVNQSILNSLKLLTPDMTDQELAKAFYTLTMFYHYQKIGLRNTAIFEAFDLFDPTSLLLGGCSPADYLPRYGTYIEDIGESVIRATIKPAATATADATGFPLSSITDSRLNEILALTSEWATNTNGYANTLYPEDAFNAFIIMTILTLFVQILPFIILFFFYGDPDKYIITRGIHTFGNAVGLQFAMKEKI